MCERLTCESERVTCKRVTCESERVTCERVTCEMTQARYRHLLKPHDTLRQHLATHHVAADAGTVEAGDDGGGGGRVKRARVMQDVIATQMQHVNTHPNAVEAGPLGGYVKTSEATTSEDTLNTLGAYVKTPPAMRPVIKCLSPPTSAAPATIQLVASTPLHHAHPALSTPIALYNCTLVTIRSKSRKSLEIHQIIKRMRVRGPLQGGGDVLKARVRVWEAEKEGQDVHKARVRVRGGAGKCVHGRQRSLCVPCRGVGVCLHLRRAKICRVCSPSGVCLRVCLCVCVCVCLRVYAVSRC